MGFDFQIVFASSRGVSAVNGFFIERKTVQSDGIDQRALILSVMERLPFGVKDTIVEEYSPELFKAWAMGQRRGQSKEARAESYRKRRENVKRLKTEGRAF